MLQPCFRKNLPWLDACSLGTDKIRLLFLPHPTLSNSTCLRWDGTESAKHFRKALLSPCLCQSWSNDDGPLSISLFPFLLNIMLEKRIKEKKKDLYAAPVPFFCTLPPISPSWSNSRRHSWGYAAFSEPEKQWSRAAERREAKPRVCIWGLWGSEKPEVGAELLRLEKWD